MTLLQSENRAAASSALVVPLFAGTLFLSAFLLFSVQPMFTRMVLPILGGSSSVWSVAMVFFQTALLAGYAYAHGLQRFLPARGMVAAHLMTLLAAASFLPIGLAAGFAAPPADGVGLWVVMLFAASVGLPFFAVSINGPLLQSWFARTGHPHASDPYFLYGASNIGSFAALIAYPLAIEPFLGAAVQARLWTAGFGVLAVMVLACGAVLMRAPAAAVTLEAAETARTPLLRQLHWILLAAVPSGLLVAVTQHMSTDIASAPFLWVLPLALFLLTFVIAFQRRPVLAHGLVIRVLPVAIAALGVAMLMSTRLPMPALIGVHLAAFFLAALMCHGELVRLRPDAGALTQFYLMLSLGGALGGSFAGLVAPNLFENVIEYPMLLVAAIALHPALWSAATSLVTRFLLAVPLTLLVVTAPIAIGIPLEAQVASWYLTAGAVTAILFIMAGRQPALAALLATGLVALPGIASALSHSLSIRSFYGVHRILDDPDTGTRSLVHGNTVHGLAWLKDVELPPVTRPQPTAYYAPSGLISSAINAARAAHGGRLGAVGVVGLGTGALACAIQPGEAWTYYEIDPDVLKIARDPNLFPFVQACAPELPVVLGDARLTLAAQGEARYDLLLIDAFSSDSVPTHLLTREAMEIYNHRLNAHGVLVFHVSNRHLELTEVVAATAATAGYRTFARQDRRPPDMTGDLRLPSIVAVAVKDPVDLPAISGSDDWHEVKPSAPAWTDDHADILSAILRKYQEE